MSNSYDFDVRIAYADTDRMGVVYYANYLVLFERGRTELLRNLGVRYRDLEDHHRLFMPVTEAQCEYFAPARYDDLIRVRTHLSELGGAHVVFNYEIQDPKSAKPLARGFTKHAVVNLLWKPTRLPDDLRKLFSSFVKK